jgi:phospholipid/cholesterol/gamma-HCH transport system substrate-binding protein
MPAAGKGTGGAGRAARVGAVVLAAMAVFAVGIFLIGRENNLFSRKYHYYVDLQSVSGIKPGNPVELDGVIVGAVHQVILPRNPKRKFIRVWLAVDRSYGQRIRADSLVRIRTLGLLGDKFLELNSGSPALPVVPDDGLIASGTDVMDNVSTISYQLKNILARVDRGQGLLGELTSDSESSRRLKANIFATLDTIQRVANKVDTGPGPLPRLLNDRQLADSLAESVANLHGVLASVQNGPGLLPGLLNDPQTRQDYEQTVASLRKVAEDLQRFSAELDNGKGLVPRLVKDEAYGREVTDNLRQFVERLNGVSEKLTTGNGTAAKLINDPQVYDAVNDILIGVNDSKLLRWLIRNRQKAGIKHRYTDAQRSASPSSPNATPEPGPDVSPPPQPTEPVPPPPGEDGAGTGFPF